jgi:hypothetical protein
LSRMTASRNPFSFDPFHGLCSLMAHAFAKGPVSASRS